MLIAVGRRIAMTAELLIKVVNKVDNKAITIRKTVPDSTNPENSCLASQSAAPDSDITSPRQIAPPYIKTIAQFIWASTIFHVIRFKTNSRTIEMIAILAMPNWSP